MKKITIAIFATLYLLVTCGVSVNFHYCMGKVRSVYLGTSENDKCGKCGMTNQKDGCCHDEAHWSKVSDNHQVGHAQQTLQAPIVIDFVKPEPIEYNAPLYNLVLQASGNHSPPPLRSQQDLCIFYCVYRV